MFSHLYVMSVVVLRYTIRRCCCSTAIDTHNQRLTLPGARNTRPLKKPSLGCAEATAKRCVGAGTGPSGRAAGPVAARGVRAARPGRRGVGTATGGRACEMPVCSCCGARANLAGDSMPSGAITIMRESCGCRHGGGTGSRGGNGGSGRTGAPRPNATELHGLRASFESEVQHALDACNRSLQAQYRLDIARKRRRVALRGEDPLRVEVPPPPLPKTLWSIADAHAHSVMCTCCRDRVQVIPHLLDPVRCFCEHDGPPAVGPTPLRRKLILLAETALVKCRKLTCEAAATDCHQQAQSLEEANDEFVEDMQTSTQQFVAAVRQNKLWPSKLRMKPHLQQRSARREKTMTLRLSSAKFRKMQPGDWQRLYACGAGCLQDVLEYTRIIRDVEWQVIKSNQQLRDMVVRGEGVGDIDAVEAQIKTCYRMSPDADICNRRFYIFQYIHHRVALG